MSLIELDRVPLRRALISVYDKTGLEEFARGLHEAGVALVSTGSTASTIAAAGVPVTEVTEVTGFPECLEGRVKTLHPRIHAGILADRRKQEHIDTLEELDVEAFDLVVVNLYPFVETVASGADQDAIIEKIVMGGIGKYFKEIFLLQQPFVKDDKVSVEEHIAAVAKQVGASIKLVNYTRFEKGEGIEKRQDDLAEEVAKLIK